MKKQLLLWLTKNVALSHSFKRLAFLAIALTLSFTASAIQYCQHTLTSGTSTIKVSYESPSTNNYVIKVESVVAMTGIHDGWYIGASTGNFQVKTKAVLSNSGKLYTITFSSTTLPNLYTNIHILYPGLIQYTNPPNVTWGVLRRYYTTNRCGYHDSYINWADYRYQWRECYFRFRKCSYCQRCLLGDYKWTNNSFGYKNYKRNWNRYFYQ